MAKIKTRGGQPFKFEKLLSAHPPAQDTTTLRSANADNLENNSMNIEKSTSQPQYNIIDDTEWEHLLHPCQL